ncbi:MAG: zf-TFIIB domain-containing protein [Deltaproteobacteria bacterium]
MNGEEAKKPLSCPECAVPLRQVYAEATYGRVLLLDQCHDCKGVWFDRWELYFLKDSSAASLSAIDVGPFLAIRPVGAQPPIIPPLVKRGLCPRCSKDLVQFKDPVFPEDSSVLRCHACSGLWLNRGGVEGYGRKKASASTKARSPEEPRPTYGDKDKVEALKKLQKELDTSGLVRRGGSGLQAFDAPALDTREFAEDVGFLILQALFRLIFKF